MNGRRAKADRRALRRQREELLRLLAVNVPRQRAHNPRGINEAPLNYTWQENWS